MAMAVAVADYMAAAVVVSNWPAMADFVAASVALWLDASFYFFFFFFFFFFCSCSFLLLLSRKQRECVREKNMRRY